MRPKNPHFMAFCEDAALPSAVMGPCESLPLARLAAACAGVIWRGFLVVIGMIGVPLYFEYFRFV